MALNHTDIELQTLNINNFKTIAEYQAAKAGGLIDDNDICFVEEQIYPDWNESDSGSPSYILNKPGLATSATSGFMSSEMVERILDFDEEEEVIAQSISLLDNKNPILPLGHLNSSITSGSVSDLSVVFSGNLHNTQVITVDNGVESLNINVSNSGNIAQHSILVINPTENDVNVRVSSYNIVGDDMVVGNHIYDTFNAFITVYHKSDRNICSKAVSGTPGTLQVTMTPYTSSSAFTEWCNMIIMVDTSSLSEQSDWDVSNKSSQSYVKNRTHYIDYENTLEDTLGQTATESANTLFFLVSSNSSLEKYMSVIEEVFPENTLEQSTHIFQTFDNLTINDFVVFSGGGVAGRVVVDGDMQMAVGGNAKLVIEFLQTKGNFSGLTPSDFDTGEDYGFILFVGPSFIFVTDNNAYGIDGSTDTASLGCHVPRIIQIPIEYIPSLPASKIYNLSGVATSGDYTDLSNKPTIPSNISDLGDVSISGVTSGQTLVYNQVTNNWENGKPGAQVTLINWTIEQ